MTYWIYLRENINISEYELCKHEYAITLKYFEQKGLTFLSHHDVSVRDNSEKERDEGIIFFIDRYLRRHERLKESIRENDSLVFISRQPDSLVPEDKIVKQFIQSVLKINSKLCFFLVFLVAQGEDYIFHNQVLIFNYSKYRLKNFEGSTELWMLTDIDWKSVYVEIEKLISLQIKVKDNLN